MKLDIGLAVESLLGVTKYGINATYTELEQTWTDERQIPTLKEIETEWIKISPNITRETKLQNKYNKELHSLVWNEVKKNKSNDLNLKDLAKIEEKINKNNKESQIN